MELDDMKLAWRALNSRLDQQQALHIRLWKDNRLHSVRYGLRPLFWGQMTQLVFGALVTVMALSFWVPRIGIAHLVVLGVLVQVFGIMMMVAAGRNLDLIGRIDYAAPVLEIQRRIAALRAWRVKVEAPAFAVVGSFAWIPFALMEIARSGIDLTTTMPNLMMYLVLVGFVSLVLVASVFWLVSRSRWRRRFENHLAGASVLKAEAMLDDITRFEHELS